MKIGIIGSPRFLTKSFHDFYPLVKYRKDFYKDGVEIEFLKNYEKIDIYDILIIHTRNHGFSERSKFVEFLSNISKRNTKIICYDGYDTSGFVDGDVIPFVDGFLKKQVLKDKNQYTLNNKDLSVRPWLAEMPTVPKYDDLIVCKQEDLSKIKLGWNIGINNYDEYPFGPLNIFRNLYKNKDKTNNFPETKSFFTSFRGTVNYNDQISLQRNITIDVLKKINLGESLLSSDKIDRFKYLDEMKSSKCIVSPFGWGEICYRDFEAMLCKSLLIKPNMQHIDTFPNIFKINETYIPVAWDLSDLEKVISDVYSNYDDYSKIVDTACNEITSYQNSYS